MTRRDLFALPMAVLAGKDLSFVRVSRKNSSYLELSDGSPYIPIGLNMVGPPRDRGLDGLLEWMSQLADNGGNYVRFWLSHSSWDLEPQRAGVYDDDRAAQVRKALDLARKRSIRVKLTIEHFRSVGGGPQAWADKPQHNLSNGGTAKDMEDWLANERSREQFKSKIQWLARTFGARPEVFGWELWNEVNAVRAKGYMPWTEAMLPVLHQTFPSNLCMQSLGSFDTDAVDAVYRKHSLLPGNDLALVHRYLDLGAKLDICHGPVDILAAAAVRTLLGYQTGRPVLLAESGAVEPRHTGPFKLYPQDKAGMLLHDVLFAPFFAGAAGTGQIWHWDSYVADNDLWRHFGRFAEFVRGLDPAAEQFVPSVVEDELVRVYRLSGKRTTLLWLRDTRNDWRSELERGEAPQFVRGFRLSAAAKARFYDPWEGRWSNGHTKDVPDFRRSLCAKLSS